MDLQLMNALDINMHTGTKITWRWYCWHRQADNAWEPGDDVEQKTDSNQHPLRDMPGNMHYMACLDMQGRIETVQIETVQISMAACTVRATLDFWNIDCKTIP